METTRTLGRSGIEVSALGFGCWAIGGEWQAADGLPLGWGKVDDEESVRAVRHALDLGVTFFDTADTYGAGHSERVLGRALGKRRADVVVATKWGNVFDERTRTLTDRDDSPAHLRRALTASLRRLGTDYVDLYQFHLSDADPERAAGLRDACEELVRRGADTRLRLEHRRPGPRRRVRARGRTVPPSSTRLNVLQDAPEMLAAVRGAGPGQHQPQPAGHGSARRQAPGRPGAGERGHPQQAAGLAAGVRGRIRRRPGVARPRRRAVSDVLTSGGRTLAQGALAWLWARSPRTVPIPGFRSVSAGARRTRARWRRGR